MIVSLSCGLVLLIKNLDLNTVGEDMNVNVKVHLNGVFFYNKLISITKIGAGDFVFKEHVEKTQFYAFRSQFVFQQVSVTGVHDHANARA